MAIFAVKFEKDLKAKKFMEDSNDRLQGNDVVKNPFTGFIKLVQEDNKFYYYLIHITPVYPRLYHVAWIFLFIYIIGFIDNGFSINIWLIAALVLFFPAMFWSKIFYKYMLKKGLRKVGYNKMVQSYQEEELIDIFITK